MAGRREKPAEDIPTTSRLSAEGDQAKIIAEVLKKYPNILKENKPVKIKMAVMENGRQQVQIITLRPQTAAALASVKPDLDQDRVQFNPGTGIRSLPKVPKALGFVPRYSI